MSPTLDEVQTALGDRYVIGRVIGHGSMGTVYYATSATNSRSAPLAVKIFEPGSDDVRARFRQEIAAVARLSHPNILSIVDSGELPGFLYLVMPYVNGKSVDRILDGEQQFSVRDALTICERVADALTLAHARGVIHRDIKPSNVIVPSENGELRFDQTMLSDFGAVGIIAPDTQATQIGQVFGTPLYMSPEQIQGRAQTTATDVYGVGGLLYRMVFGRPPFRGDNIVELMVRIVNERVSIPDEPSLPPELILFLERCLDKNPGRRPQMIDAELRRLRELVAPSTAVERGPVPGAATAGGSPGWTTPPQRPVDTGPIAESRAPEPALPAPRLDRASASYWLAILGVVLTTVAILLIATQTEWGPRASGFVIGTALIVGGIAIGILIFQWIKNVKAGLQKHTNRLLNVATQNMDLSSSLAIEVDQLLARCHGLDEQFLGKSIAIMVNEYRAAEKFDDRHAALVTAVGFMEKLSTRLSPWYVRNDKLIAFIVSAVGIASGLVTMLETLLKID